MKTFHKYFCLCFILLLPLTIQAKLTDTVIFRHPENNSSELWITNLEDTRNASLLYRSARPIYTFATQKDGPHIIMSVIDLPFGADAYLFNRKHPNRKPRNLTQKRYGSVLHVDISERGDVVFIAKGIYLISKHELEKPVPTATLLREVKANSVIWSPNGKLIAYDILHHRGIYTFNIETQEVLEISKFGRFPAFSPDGKKLAFVDIPFAIPQDIYVVSLDGPGDVATIDLEERTDLLQLKWSPDGQYIIYTTAINTFAAPIQGGGHIKLFEHLPPSIQVFDWVSPNEQWYPVESQDKLTTL